MDLPFEIDIIRVEASKSSERTNDMNKIFSNNLKKFRQQKNYTQEQVAEVLGVSAHTVSRWECNTTLPDVTILPEIAKLYCVTIDDFFKESSVAYENYAQRLASIYESTREPEDFIRADNEFKKLIKKGEYSTEDLRQYGILHHFMMQYSKDKAIDLFNKVLEKGPNANMEVFWKTKNQKMVLYSQIGKSKESIKSFLKRIDNGSEFVEEWRYLILAYSFDGDYKKAYEWFLKAIKKFPNDALLYTLGGDVCRKLERKDEALLYWDKAIELDDSYLDAKYSKANYLEEIGEFNKCYTVCLEIIEDLEKAGLDIEAASEKKRAEEFYKNIVLKH